MNVKPSLAIIFASLIASAIAVGCAENPAINNTTTQTKSRLEQSSGEIAYSDDNRIYIKVDIENFLSQPE